jgi:DNA-binding NarL/FixJ family response regulator
MEAYRVIVADDHGLFRQGLRKLVEEAPGLEVVGEAEDGGSLIQLLNGVTADIVLLDIAMPNLRGIEAIPRIKAIHPNIKILIVTMHNDKELLYRALSAGVDGYFLKKEVDRELFAAIEKIRQGQIYISSEISDRMGDDWGRIREGLQRSLLTDREKEILQLIADGKSNKEMAGLLYISVHTVERHRANIMAKLDIHTMADLIKYAIQRSYA